MALVNQDRALERALMTAFEQARRLCKAEVEPTGGIVITFAGHVRGLWKFRDGNFAFTPAGYVQPTFSTPVLEEAVRHSLDVICRA